MSSLHITLVTTAVFDKEHEQGYFFDTPLDEGSLMFLMKIPVTEIKKRDLDFLLYVVAGVVGGTALSILCVLVLLILLRRFCRGKKHSLLTKSLLEDDSDLNSTPRHIWTIDMSDLRIDKLLYEGPLGKNFLGVCCLFGYLVFACLCLELI